ncbi:hypothetical protein K461DRAFT_296118 [Myriangium duriaei CBS 260.36]|uniref:Rhodopsin domain-containing protein n=1 Tax=Myriangium duriaei CBS 260.36 TaxID=1168546 RepID=A0A9P4IWE9_9PEZI|nr:hypothetical protein K461DRAFT_296118 [Myriangium duriaei CBS 260.36]
MSPGASNPDGSLGAMVSILTWFLTVMMGLSVLTRLAIRLSGAGIRYLDDGPICIAALLCTGQCVSTSIAAANGFGKHRDLLSQDQTTTVFKSLFVSDVLFIPTLLAAQLSTLLLIGSIPASKTLRSIIRWTNISNVIWSVPALITLVVCAGLTHDWTEQPTAINLHTFWAIISGFSIFFELHAVVMPCVCILPIKAPWSKRLGIMSSFMFRLLVVVAICVRVYFLYAVKSTDTDATYKLAGFVIASQFVLTLAITTASIPILSRFLENFETGMLGVNNMPNDNTSRGLSHSASGLHGSNTNKITSLSRQQQKPGRYGDTPLSPLSGRKNQFEDTEIMITTEFQVQSNTEVRSNNSEIEHWDSAKEGGVRTKRSFEESI